MSLRKILILSLILATLIVPFTQLSFGFYYIKSIDLCPLQHDIALLMSIGGVFQAIFFAAAFAFVYLITPARFKIGEKKESNRISQILIGCITCIVGTCAIIFFILIQVRVYGNYKKFQWNDATKPNYCLFTIFYSALGSIIGTYVAFILFSTVTIILLFGIAA
ncbi:unnamed protein product [Rotaria sp. Silwood2]|nr:unnamed protein product [Rotaria sp. Silwood2]CAF3119663.1 unnamed protein product [Rotaria sp. Silwood2]CAF3246145.1 unnamed protein product [Rotaria sp. Silwood2]CAF3894351.1 unnamed protein product [Rotaria sp. Silwood2]CAF4002932.1 unnamed protein product [Rotaria sp. Silwood2]